MPVRDAAVEQQSNPYLTTRLLLDGQQRLTSLLAVTRGEPVTVRGRKRPIELLFNLEHPEQLSVVTEVEEDDGIEDHEDTGEPLTADEADSTEDDLQKRLDQMTFVVWTRKLGNLPQWVRVTDVLKSQSDGPFLERAGVTDFKDPRYQKYTQRLARLRGIRNYVYRMDLLERTLSYSEVTEIFVRVNSRGAKLRSSDLALAQITAKWRGALKIFQQFERQCAKDGFNLELGLHLKNLVAFATGQSRFKTVGSLSVEQLSDSWQECVPGMEFAINFAKSNVGIDSPVLLSSPFILVTLAFYGHQRGYELSPKEASRLREWLLLANAKGRYSRGSTETLLDQDLATLKQGGGADELIDRLKLQVGRLNITPEELEGRTQRSALFKTMFLAFRAAGAKDWRSNLAIGFSHSGAQHRLQFHHIFPRALLKASFTTREVNDIANLAFISGKTNRKISDKEPEKYIPSILESTGSAAFEAQCLPTKPELLPVQQYREFLRVRRATIAARLNDFLGVTDS